MNTSALLDAVYATPGDDEPRLVLGDALLEQGDPRGALIAEEKRRLDKGVASVTTKERALLKAHASTWLGPLDLAVRAPTFRLGFVSGGTLKGGVYDVDRVRDCREWRTVERLVARGLRSSLATQLLSIPHLVSLAQVDWVEADVIAAVAGIVGPLRWRSLKYGPPNTAVALVELSRLSDALPALQHLEFSGRSLNDPDGVAAWEMLLNTPLVARLQLVDVFASVSLAQRILDVTAASGVARLRITTHSPLAPIEWERATGVFNAPPELGLRAPKR